ncbi:MAG: DUF3667 domain-containing protein [Pedobacter sp.]|nr:MAG: DUF3667 domain-containing protein [Pedobacter sp.]
MSGKYRKEHNCLNCGFQVEEHYCSRCGQPNLELKESFWHFVSHSIAHYFHFDNKFFQTLVPLLTKPGKVTLDYLAGKRARYINPISMYIFVSIVYFIVVPPSKKRSVTVTGNNMTTEQRKAALDTASNRLRKAGLDTAGFLNRAGNEIADEIDKDAFRKVSFLEQKKVIAELREINIQKQSEGISDKITAFERIHTKRNDSTYASYLARQNTLDPKKRDNMYERFMKKRSYDFSQKSDVLEEQIERNRSKQYFLFMPLMALFFMFTFRRNHIRYLDHLVFTIHGMTAFFIVMIVTKPTERLLGGLWGPFSGFLEILLAAWVCWYLYQSLSIFYQRSKSTTFWRMVLVLILYTVTVNFSETILRNILFYLS